MHVTWGAKPVRCLRWLLTRLDFLMIEWKLSLEIFSMRLSSSPFRYFSTKEIDVEIRTLVSTTPMSYSDSSTIALLALPFRKPLQSQVPHIHSISFHTSS